MKRITVLLISLGIFASACSDSSNTSSSSNESNTSVESKTSGQSGTSGSPVAQSTAAFQFTATTLAGGSYDTSRVIGTKPVVFWVWAPWCSICNREAPTVKEAYEKYGDRVEFIGVAGRDTPSAMRAFSNRHGLNDMTSLVSEDAALWTKLGVPGQPSWVFVSADSKVSRHIGAYEKSALFAELDALAS